MFTKSYTSQVKTFAVFIFILLAGGLITFLTLQTSKSDSQDIRSRAANSETILKEWNFTSGTTAGWIGSTGVTVSIPPQLQIYPPPPLYLNAQYTSKGNEITNNDTAPRIILAESLKVPLGIKKFRILLRVTVPSIQEQGNSVTSTSRINRVPTGPQPTPKTVPFKFTAQYLKKIVGNTWTWSQIGTFSGITEQGFQEFVIPWEDSLPLQSDRFRLVFNLVGASAAVNVQIQKIVIVVEKVSDTPTPTPIPTPATVSYTGIVRSEETQPTITPSSGRTIMIAPAPNYVLVVGGTTYELKFDTKTTVTPTTTFIGDVAVRSGGSGNSAGMNLYVGTGALVGCQVAVTGVITPSVGSRPAILVSSIKKTGACGL